MRHTGDPGVAREGRTSLIGASARSSSAHLKQSLKSRLFGIAITLSVFVVFVSPMVAKRW